MMRKSRGPMTTVALALVMLALLAGYGRYRFGSVTRALAYVRGERLFVDDVVKSLGRVEEGRERRVEFLLTNHANRPVEVIGAKSSCGCTMVNGLPMTIPPTASRPLVVKVKPRSRSNGPVTVLRVFTDEPRTPEMGLRVVAQVIPNNVSAGR